ncbi:MAG: rhomboid family intramembrane serine protease [Nanopusillaceae archaeon]
MSIYKNLKSIPMTYIIIIITIFTYIIELFLISKDPLLILQIAFYPYYSLIYPWTYITSIFASDPTTIYPLLIDTLALLFLGLIFEFNYGKVHLLILFILSGIFGNIAFYLQFYNNPYIGGVGSSGGISGILGALAVLKPKEKIIIFPIMIPINMSYAAVVWIIFNLVGLMFQFLPIGFSAHLGGIFFGILYGYLLRKKLKNKSDIIEYYS